MTGAAIATRHRPEGRARGPEGPSRQPRRPSAAVPV